MEDTVYNKKIIIFGDGDLAIELATFAGFDSKDIFYISKSIEENLNYKLLSKTSKLYLAYSDPELKKKIHKKLKLNGYNVSSYIHETVIISNNSKLGEGCIIFPYTVISYDVNIADLVFINCSCNIGHHTKIGSYTSVMSNSCVSGHCNIGSENYIGTTCSIIPSINTTDKVKIGVGGVVIKNINFPGSYFGNPVKKIL